MKTSIFLLIFFINSICCFAQQKPNKTELIVGLNQSWYDSTIPWIPGITAGISQKISFTKAITLNVELLYVNYKNRVVFEQTFFGVDTKSITRSSNNTIKIPVLLNFGKNKNLSIGVMYGFNMGGKYNSESIVKQSNTPANISNEKGRYPFKESFKRKDLDFVLGFAKTKNKITWEIRPTFSLLYIGENFRSGISDADMGGVTLHFLMKYKISQ